MTFNSDNEKRYSFPLERFYFEEEDDDKQNKTKIKWTPYNALERHDSIKLFQAHCDRNKFNADDIELIKNS